MKLMIVDDEQLTREGIYESIHWPDFGIRQVTLAEDGLLGLELAKTEKPDIILSDVRMPRMDGIRMIEEIRTYLPDCVAIFMSGFSDKEYLKSAIKLKAVNYVEKPIDLQEIADSVRESVKLVKDIAAKKKGRQLHKSLTSSQLALTLIRPNPHKDLWKQFEEIGIRLSRKDTFTTVVIDFPEASGGEADLCIQRLEAYLHGFSTRQQARTLCALKDSHYIICHLILSHEPGQPFLAAFCRGLLEHLEGMEHVYVAAGKTVAALEDVPNSYNDAVALLQSAFFYSESAALLPQNINGSWKIPHTFYDEFGTALQEPAPDAARRLLEQLYATLQHHNGTLASYVKDVYFRLLHILSESAEARYSNIMDVGGSASTVTHAIRVCRNLQELHHLLDEKLSLFYTSLARKREESSMVGMIRSYLMDHISDSALSVRSVSDYTGLSISYLCTLYKNETGETLNQYITNVRMEKAKKMMRNPRLKVTEISAAVGYTDSNYFAKLFKKKTGLSPSEYRESAVE